MGAADYLVALSSAVADGVTLPHDQSPVPATPWDPDLAAAFTVHRLVVHEERVMDDVLDSHMAATRPPPNLSRQHSLPPAGPW
jgi:hypothetical protein